MDLFESCGEGWAEIRCVSLKFKTSFLSRRSLHLLSFQNPGLDVADVSGF